jgi:hypothetical protein
MIMTTKEDEINLTLQLKNVRDDFDADELNQLVQTLMRRLEDVGVELATLMREQESPQGAKGDPITIGVLLVAVLPATLPKVMEFLQTWVIRNNEHMIKAKVQQGDRSAEIEFSENIPLEKLQKHLEMIKQMVKE